MASFCAVLLPLDVLDEVWDLIESVSEGFLTYSCIVSPTLFSLYLNDLNDCFGIFCNPVAIDASKTSLFIVIRVIYKY